MEKEIMEVTPDEYRDILIKYLPKNKIGNSGGLYVTVSGIGNKNIMISSNKKLITPFEYYLGKR